MNINNMSNLISFGYSLLTGLLAGIIYDIFKALRHAKGEKNRLKQIADLLFWIVITILFFITVLKVSDGILRGFLFIGFFGGGGLYLLTISKFFYLMFLRIFKLIIQLVNEIIRIIKIPLVKIKLKYKIRNFLLRRKENKELRKKHWKLIRGKK